MTRASDTAKLLGAGATILDGTTISTADNTTQLTLTSTDADASSGPQLDLYRNSASPADSDVFGRIRFLGENDADEQIAYATIFSKAVDVSDGTEDANLRIDSIVGGTNSQRLEFNETEAVFNEGSADLDFRVESNGDANCLFVDGGNDKVGIGTNAPQGFLSINKNASGSALPHIHLIDNSDAREAFVTNNAGDLILGTMNSSDDTIDSSINILTSIILFKTADTERMRIVSGGNVLVGTTNQSPAEGTGVGVRIGSNGTSQFSSSGDAGLCSNRTSDNGNAVVLRRDGTVVGTISVTGSSTAYNTSSDYRLKENVVEMTNATTRLKQLQPKRFNFIADADTTVDGFLAHQVSSIVPEAVFGTHNEVDADGNAVMQGIDQSKLVPLLVKTIQELEARITALES